MLGQAIQIDQYIDLFRSYSFCDVIETHCLGINERVKRALQAQGPPLASFAPAAGCPDSVFDPIDTYYVPLAGYAGWLRPGPYIRIYRLGG